ncbi:hypothetical protein LXL04_015702 [Taraxacum kok-saghyz]
MLIWPSDVGCADTNRVPQTRINAEKHNYITIKLRSFENSYIPKNPRTPPISYISQPVITLKKPTSELSKTVEMRTHIFPRTRELPQFPISPNPLLLSKHRLRNSPKRLYTLLSRTTAAKHQRENRGKLAKTPKTPAKTEPQQQGNQNSPPQQSSSNKKSKGQNGPYPAKTTSNPKNKSQQQDSRGEREEPHSSTPTKELQGQNDENTLRTAYLPKIPKNLPKQTERSKDIPFTDPVAYCIPAAIGKIEPIVA